MTFGRRGCAPRRRQREPFHSTERRRPGTDIRRPDRALRDPACPGSGEARLITGRAYRHAAQRKQKRPNLYGSGRLLSVVTGTGYQRYLQLTEAWIQGRAIGLHFDQLQRAETTAPSSDEMTQLAKTPEFDLCVDSLEVLAGHILGQAAEPHRSGKHLRPFDSRNERYLPFSKSKTFLHWPSAASAGLRQDRVLIHPYWGGPSEGTVLPRRANTPSKHHKPEKVVAKLHQVDVLTSQGRSIAGTICGIAVTEVTYYRWRQEFGRLKTDQVRRMRGVGAEERPASRRSV